MAIVLLGYDLRELIDSNGEENRIRRHTQSAILTTSVAIYRLLVENGNDIRCRPLLGNIASGLRLTVSRRW